VAAHAVREDQSFISIASNGMMVRSPVNQIRVIGRAAKGVRLVNLAEGATLVSVSVADADDDDEAPATPAAVPTPESDAQTADDTPATNHD